MIAVAANNKIIIVIIGAKIQLNKMNKFFFPKFCMISSLINVKRNKPTSKIVA